MIVFLVDKVSAGKAEKFTIDPNSITSMKLLTNIPEDSNARAREISVGVLVKGMIIPGFTSTAGDNTVKLAQWAQVPAESIDAYRNVTLSMYTAKVCERQFKFSQAYVASYKEIFADDSGTGTFEILIRQKRAKIWDDKSLVIFKGGFAGEPPKEK